MTEETCIAAFEHVEASPVLHQPAPAQTTRLLVGQVISVVDDTFRLKINGGASMAAHKAVSCVLQPCVGDTVMCSSSSAGLHVLHILKRESNRHPAVISVPGAPSLSLEQTVVEVRAENLTADVRRIRARSDELHLVTRLTNLVTGGMELVADRLKRICRMEMSSAEDSVRTVENTDTLRTGRMLREASEIISHRSEIAVIEARGDVRVNGERITMG